MKEIIYELRANGVLIFFKSLIIVLVFVGLYNILSLGESTDQAIDRNFTTQSEYELYRVSDSLTDPTLFGEFRNTPNKVAAVGVFYDSLNSEDKLIFLSAFNQPMQIANFGGDEKFRHTYGTGMTDRGSYEDPLGRLVTDVKSLQMNKNAFDFYGLSVESGRGFEWEKVDYSQATIPVLFGASYSNYYSVGDRIDGWLYFSERTFEVVGFLEDNSAIYFNGEVNHYLDEFMVVPYPSNLAYESFPDKELYGILSFAAINGSIAAPREMGSREVLSKLDAIGSSSGFDNYTLANMPSYLVQLTFMRQIIEDNYELIVTIQVLLMMASLTMSFVIDRALCLRRKPKTRLWVVLGDDNEVVMRRHSVFWLIEYTLMIACLFVGFLFLPNQNGMSLIFTMGALVCFASIDATIQYLMLKRTLKTC